MTLGGKISMVLHLKSVEMTQRDLAELTGITEWYISLVVVDQRVPSLAVASRIAKALGLSLSQLLQGVEI